MGVVKINADVLTGTSASLTVSLLNNSKTIPITIAKGASPISEGSDLGSDLANLEIKAFGDTNDHWAKEYIGKLASKGVINGMGDNLFKPDNNLTRAQFVTMLANAAGVTDFSAYQTSKFSDVYESIWSFKYVNWAADNGIVGGIGSNMFAPDEKITREQMSKMLCSFASYLHIAIPQVEGSANISQFTDESRISAWARDYVQTVVGAEIMTGMPEGDFKPAGNATRAQAATVLYKFLVKVSGN